MDYVEVDSLEKFTTNKAFKDYPDLKELAWCSDDIIELMHIIRDKEVQEFLEDEFFSKKCLKVLKNIGAVEPTGGTLAQEDKVSYLDGKYNIEKLKQILRKNNLKVGGKKAELIERVVEHNLIETPKPYKLDTQKVAAIIEAIAQKYTQELEKEISTLPRPLQEEIKNAAVENDNTDYLQYLLTE